MADKIMYNGKMIGLAQDNKLYHFVSEHFDIKIIQLRGLGPFFAILAIHVSLRPSYTK